MTEQLKCTTDVQCANSTCGSNGFCETKYEFSPGCGNCRDANGCTIGQGTPDEQTIYPVWSTDSGAYLGQVLKKSNKTFMGAGWSGRACSSEAPCADTQNTFQDIPFLSGTCVPAYKITFDTVTSDEEGACWSLMKNIGTTANPSSCLIPDPSGNGKFIARDWACQLEDPNQWIKNVTCCNKEGCTDDNFHKCNEDCLMGDPSACLLRQPQNNFDQLSPSKQFCLAVATE